MVYPCTGDTRVAGVMAAFPSQWCKHAAGNIDCSTVAHAGICCHQVSPLSLFLLLLLLCLLLCRPCTVALLYQSLILSEANIKTGLYVSKHLVEAQFKTLPVVVQLQVMVDEQPVGMLQPLCQSVCCCNSRVCCCSPEIAHAPRARSVALPD